MFLLKPEQVPVYQACLTGAQKGYTTPDHTNIQISLVLENARLILPTVVVVNDETAALNFQSINKQKKIN